MLEDDGPCHLPWRRQVFRLDFLRLVDAVFVQPSPAGDVETVEEEREDPVREHGRSEREVGVGNAVEQALAEREVEGDFEGGKAHGLSGHEGGAWRGRICGVHGGWLVSEEVEESLVHCKELGRNPA